jgi:hypothetical protein
MQFARWKGRVCAALVILLAGCSTDDRPELGITRGRVTMDGQPLSGVTVSFRPIDGGRQSCGDTDADGRYVLIYLRDIHGAKVGQHRVTIGPSDVAPSAEKKIPERYNLKTTLEAEVRAGENSFDFALTAK